MKTLERARERGLRRFRPSIAGTPALPLLGRRLLRPRFAIDGRVLLNLGCGNTFSGNWNNLDAAPAGPEVEPWDARRGIPYESGSFDVVYHSHFLEHLTLDLAAFVTAECFRVLKPGGILRIVVPDLEYGVRLYLEAASSLQQVADPSAWEHYEWAVINLLDQMTREVTGGEMGPFLASPSLTDLPYIVRTTGGTEAHDIHCGPGAALSRIDRVMRALREPHRVVSRLKQALRRKTPQASGELHRWAYDVHSLTFLLTVSGFCDIIRRTELDSGIPDWPGISLDVISTGETRKPHSLVLEACNTATEPQVRAPQSPKVGTEAQR